VLTPRNISSSAPSGISSQQQRHIDIGGGKDTGGVNPPKDTGGGLAKDTGGGLAEDTGGGLADDTGRGPAEDTGGGLANNTGGGLAEDTGVGLVEETGGDPFLVLALSPGGMRWAVCAALVVSMACGFGHFAPLAYGTALSMTELNARLWLNSWN